MTSTLSKILIEARSVADKQPFKEITRLYLGDASGRINDGIRKDLVYVRDLEDFDSGGSPIYSAPELVRGFAGLSFAVSRGDKVIIGYDLDGEIAVIGADYNATIEVDRNPGAANYGDSRTKTLDVANFTPLLSYPITPAELTGMLVAVEPYLFVDESGIWTTFPGAQVDLTSYVPSVVGTKLLAILSLKSNLGTPSIVVTTSIPIDSSLSFSSSGDIKDTVSSFKTGVLPIKAYILEEGQVNVGSASNYMDMRAFLASPRFYGFPNRIVTTTHIQDDYSVVIQGPLTVEAPLYVDGRLKVT